jgi:hypothetical protein
MRLTSMVASSRDGVTSCLATNENYTVRAQLGTYSDPFTVAGHAGGLATTTATANMTATSSTASPGATAAGPSSSATEMSTTDSTRMAGGVIAGVTIGSIAGLCLVVTGSYLFYRCRRSKLAFTEKSEDGTHELHAHSAVHESGNRPLYKEQGPDVFELPRHEPAELFAEHAVEIDDTERNKPK